MNDLVNKNKQLSNISFSVLDLVHVLSGQTPSDSFRNSLDLARHVEQLGYKRYWLAEHHNMPGIASSATAVLIGHIAGGTSTIRVGSGGIMLPNHSPLVVAEQFGTLESLFPGRIDLGIGRAPGTDQLTSIALRRDLKGNVEQFPQHVQEIQQYFGPPDPTARVRAIPGEGLQVPVWLLGSSTYGAQLAAHLGVPYAFASHFAPTNLHAALSAYRQNFQPSESLATPYAMACVNVIAAETDEEANYLATSLYQAFLNVIRGKPGRLKPPVEQMDGIWEEAEEYAVHQMLQYSFIGSATTVKKDLQRFLDTTQVDELMVATAIFDHQARLQSYELVQKIWA
ncbi:LLM class flavin-dependent oxidoreductase [Telluribacter sp.]|jgi:luciferase family oxidoreductase group 1|uniref:LLM class flavin-dependent oxidoreductase n=1 Tax=Telluribacter sp. TaxID=1978767 RepID=UPI002E10F0BE|nr:LLM class flavin-dependent oxidoreductase [Telluribacter sp.]